MSIKLMGALLLIAGCGSVGFQLAAAHRSQERSIRRLGGILDHMICQLHYRLTPLPDMCREAGEQTKGVLSVIFRELAREMDNQLAPDALRCMYHVLAKTGPLPSGLRQLLLQLGEGLGKFDLEGQLRGLESVRQECTDSLRELEKGRDSRLRGYKTLGLCTGAALAILLV